MNNHNGTLHRGWQSLQRWRIQIFVITWLAYAAFYFTRKAFSVAKLGIAEDPSFELDKSAMADLDALYLAAYAVGQFMWGVFADRFGTRVVVLGGLLTSALAALAMGTFATLPIFAACMVVQGLAQSTGWSGLCKNIGAFFATYERGRVLGLWSTCYAFGGLVATPFAGWCAYRLTHDWRMAFLSSAGVVLAVAVLFFFLQRNRPQDVGLPPVEAEAAPPADAPRPSHSGALLKALRNPHVLVLGIAYFLLKPARYAILLWGPVIIYERMPEIGKVASAIVPSAFEVAGLAGPDPHRPGLGQAVRRPPHAGLRAQPGGADPEPGAVRPGDAERQPVPGGRPAVHDGRHPLRAGLDDQRRRRHRLRHQRGGRHRHRLRQRLRLGRGDPRRPAAGLLRHPHGVLRVHRHRAARQPAAGAVLEQPAGRAPRRTEGACRRAAAGGRQAALKPLRTTARRQARRANP